MKRRTFLLSSAMLATAPAWLRAAPQMLKQPVNYIVPVAPGGGSDYIGRAVTNAWSKTTGQTFIVDNQSGGGGVVACQKAARAAPDGTTLMQGYVATLATSPATRKVPYDPDRDFTPVGMIGGTPNVLIVNARSDIKTFDDFVKFARAQGDKVNYGTAGAGSLTHLLMELLQQKLGTHMVHIAYKGVAPAFTDMIAGSTTAVFPGLAAAVPQIKGGMVTPLAVTGPQRDHRYPDVPTFDELGIQGFTDVLQWYGVSAPAGMDPALVTYLNQTLGQALAAPELEKQLDIEAVQIMPLSPEAFAEYARRDRERWARVAKEQNIQLNA